MYEPLENRNAFPRFELPWKFGGGAIEPSISVATTAMDGDDRFTPAALHSCTLITMVPPRGLGLFGSYCRQTL